MSDVQDHADAILNLLRAVTSPSPALEVCDGRVPNGVLPPYVLVYLSHSRPVTAPGNTLNGLSRQIVTRAICHCVGADHVASRAVAARVEGALLNVRPVIAGRDCGLIRQDQAIDPQKDETTGSLYMDAIQIYVFSST